MLWALRLHQALCRGWPSRQESPLLHSLLFGSISDCPLLLHPRDTHRSTATPVHLAAAVAFRLKGSAGTAWGLQDLEKEGAQVSGAVRGPLKPRRCHSLCQRSQRPGLRLVGAPAPHGVSRVGRLFTQPCTKGPKGHSLERKGPSSLSPVRVSRKCLERILSLLHYCQGCLRIQKLSRTASLYSEFCSQKKVKREKTQEQATLVSRLGSAWALSYLHPSLRGPQGC